MNWKTSAAVAVFSFFGVGSLVYLLLHKDQEYEDDLLFKTSKAIVIEVKIPKQSVGYVIGKGGSIIKEIETKSDTTVKIIDDTISADFKICVIRGTLECVQFAECLIHQIIINQPQVETFEMYVPSVACGRIIGKHGDNIRMINKSSKAKLFLESAVTSSKMLERKLVIKGTPEQIALAKILVEQKLEEEKIFRSKVESMMPNGHDRRKKYVLPSKGGQKEADSYRQEEESLGNRKNDLLEVYLSAIESPDRFWLRKVGRWSADLNELVEEMSDYYSKEENKLLHKLENLKLGQIVAVSKSDCEKWFRAEVLDTQINPDAKEPEIFLYNVDFGDTEKCKKGDVYELKTDFLKLRFQAIECMLAKVKPRYSAWSKEAINHLKDLKNFGKWHSMTARVLKYEERSRGMKKEKSLIPCVELYDTHEYKVINVAEVLVEKGLALWKNENEEEEKEEEEKEEIKTSEIADPVNDLELEETVA